MTNEMKLSGFIGNVEMSYTPNGHAVSKGYVKFTNGKSPEGEWLYNFMTIVAWNETAELLNNLDTTKIYLLEGVLRANNWESEKGKQKTFEMLVFSVTPHQSIPSIQHKTPPATPVKPQKSYQKIQNNAPLRKPLTSVQPQKHDDHPF